MQRSAPSTPLRLVRAALTWALLAAVAACATPGLPPAEPASEITSQAVRRANRLYLYPERLDRRVLVGALDALEQRFDLVRFEDRGDHGVLWVGPDRAVVPLEAELRPAHFREVLGQALAFVEVRLEPDALEDDEDLELLALRGGLAALDHYSTIFSGRGTEDFRIRFSGKLHGIGARIGRRDGNLTAVRVFPSSPAQKGGLEDGDAIIAIEGDPTRPLSVSEAVERIRGPIGSTIALTVLRAEEKHELEIVRGEITVPTVEVEMLEDGVGYARVLQMSRSTPEEFRTKLKGLGKISGLVLDLRGNSGGSMLASATLADFFLSSGTIFRVYGRDGVEPGVRNRMTATPDILFPYPVAILVDESTASAAEIFSGALAPLPRVTLIGQKTFGKGLIQRVMDLPDDNLLKLTVAEYRLSSDRTIHLTGIEPDVTLSPISTDRLGPLGNLPEGSIAYLRKPGEDDRFPIEVGREIVQRGRYTGSRAIRERANQDIRDHLVELGIEWDDPGQLPLLLPQALRIRGESVDVVSGETRSVRIRVTNPNDFPIPEAWLALESPTTYVSDGLAPLGTLPPGGESTAELELTLPDGLSVPELPVLVHVASGPRTVESQRITLRVAPRLPELEIAVVALDDESAAVTLHNAGARATGEISVFAPGVTRAIERLESGEERTLELPLAEKVDSVWVTMIGPNVQRRIKVPLAIGSERLVPPALELRRTGLLRRSRLRADARADEGLDRGWIAIDGEKQRYVAWNGRTQGSLEVDLEAGDHGVRTHVVTVSGVEVTDTRLVTAD